MKKDDINLLPSTELQTRQGAVLLRHLNEALWVMIASLASLSLVYAGMWATLRRTEQQLQQQPRVNAQDSTTQHVRDTNIVVDVVDKYVAQQQPWTPLVVEMLKVVPHDATITELEVTDALLAEQPTSALLVRGRTRSRSEITAFEESLRKLPWVKYIEAPLHNLASDDDAFSFTVMIYRQGQ